jgi:hypothetical protein
MDEQRGCSRGQRQCERDLSKRDDPRVDPVRPATDGDPRGAAQHLRAREHARRGCGREAAIVVQEEHEERDQADLGRDVERARDAQQPDALVAKRRRHVPVLLLDRGFGAQQRRADDGRGKTPGREPEERGPQADVCSQRGEHDGRDRAAERDRRLTDS